MWHISSCVMNGLADSCLTVDKAMFSSCYVEFPISPLYHVMRKSIQYNHAVFYVKSHEAWKINVLLSGVIDPTTVF